MNTKRGPVARGKGKGGLLLVFGVMVSLLMGAGFVILGFVLPAQVSSSLEEEIDGTMLPDVRAAFQETNSAIQAELDAKRVHTLERTKNAFTAQNESKARALIKTILPLVEVFDVDGANQVLTEAVDTDTSIAGVQYRLQAGDQPTEIGETGSSDLLRFQVTEKNDFADVEITLLVTPTLLNTAEQEEKASFATIEARMSEANQALEQRILDNAQAMQASTVASLRVRVCTQ